MPRKPIEAGAEEIKDNKAEEVKAEEVKVRVGALRLHENGLDHAPGDDFRTTAQRAAALGDLVEILAE